VVDGREFRSTLDAAGELGRRGPSRRGLDVVRVSESLIDALRSDERVAALADRLEAAVTAGELPPAAAARQILDAFLPASSDRAAERRRPPDRRPGA